MGSPEELMKQNGIYKHMVSTQLAAAEWKL